MARWTAIAIRDALVAASCGALWLLDARDLGGATGWAIAIGAAVVTAVVGFFVHEWGHAAGAWAAKAKVTPNPPWSVFLFRFDVVHNTPAQFLSMSRGGYIGSLLGVAVIAAAVPWDRPSGWIALGLTAAGVLATFVLEVPTHLAVRRGEPMPSAGVVYVSETSRDG